MDESFRSWKRSIIQIRTRSDPKNRGKEPKTLRKRARNPLMKNAGLTKPTAAQPSGGPMVRGDWYVWHAHDGLRARGPPHSDACKRAPGRRVSSREVADDRRSSH